MLMEEMFKYGKSHQAFKNESQVLSTLLTLDQEKKKALNQDKGFFFFLSLTKF